MALFGKEFKTKYVGVVIADVYLRDNTVDWVHLNFYELVIAFKLVHEPILTSEVEIIILSSINLIDRISVVKFVSSYMLKYATTASTIRSLTLDFS